MKKILYINLLISILVLYSFSANAKLDLMLETGGVWQYRNDVKIPGNTGTRVDFDNYDQGPFFHYRAELFWNWGSNSNIRFVYAPFNTVVKGPLTENVSFNGKSFVSGQDLEVDYTFNSYRVTYFYSFFGTGDSQLNLGLTGKIRDAEIKFSQGAQESAYDNVGFVPLIYFEFQAPIGSIWLFNFNMDGAAASQGRAFDVALKLRRKISKDYKLGFGLRGLEGGADNDKVYTFSYFNYAVVDFVGSF
ncbi:MAG: hypothetical protein EP319_07815 [Deltaproteobacteria bacterium]|nr:MAG: hypothetical protein EP319_07815 [Deltaproteobacteria bacterium]